MIYYSGASKGSSIPILRSMLVIFHGHGKRNRMACGRVRRPYVRTSHYMTFLYEGIGVRAGGAGGL